MILKSEPPRKALQAPGSGAGWAVNEQYGEIYFLPGLPSSSPPQTFENASG
jgi:hypothetical protein